MTSYRLDGRLPSWKVIDEHCGAVHGSWRNDSSERPPSPGNVEMDISGRRQVTWQSTDGFNSPAWEPTVDELAWDTGDTLRLTVAGDQLPGFEVEVTVPAKVELTSHDFRSLKENELHVSRSTPLELSWAATPGDVHLGIYQFPRGRSTAEAKRSVWCVWPASTGGVSVSTDVLGQLVPSTPDLATNVYFGGGHRVSRDLSGTTLEVYTWNNEVARVFVE